MNNDYIKINKVAFIESASNKDIANTFEMFGFVPHKNAKRNSIKWYKQNDVSVLINDTSASFAQKFSQQHGDSICAIGLLVDDALKAHRIATSKGAKNYDDQQFQSLPFPAVYSMGGTLIYFVEADWIKTINRDGLYVISKCHDALIDAIDHIAINVEYGKLNEVTEFFQNLFRLELFSSFNIRGDYTEFHTCALIDQETGLRIVINESSDEKSQIVEFLKSHKGAGIQHIAFSSSDIYSAVKKMRANGIEFMNIPDSYYADVNNRIPNHGENLADLSSSKILIDKDKKDNKKILLQIFTKSLLGAAFFEIIQRKGNPGFGEGNITALFKSVEQDQINRGVL